MYSDHSGVWILQTDKTAVLDSYRSLGTSCLVYVGLMVTGVVRGQSWRSQKAILRKINLQSDDESVGYHIPFDSSGVVSQWQSSLTSGQLAICQPVTIELHV